MNALGCRLASLLVPRWLLAVCNQGAIAIGNLAILLVASRIDGLQGVGLIGAIGAAGLIGISLVRTLVTEPYLSKSLDSDTAVDAHMRAAIHILGVTNGAGVMGIVFHFGGFDPMRAILGLGLGYLWTLQDSARLVRSQAQDLGRAVVADVTAAAFVPLYALSANFIPAVPVSINGLMAAWCAGLMVAVAISGRDLIGPLRVGRMGAWWSKHHRRHSTPLLLDAAGYQVGANVALLIFGAVAGQTEMGAVRAVGALFSPLALVFTGLTWWLIPELTRLEPARRIDKCRRVTWALLVTSCAGASVAVAAGPILMRWLFGSESNIDRVALTIAAVGSCALAGAAPGLSLARAEARYRPFAIIRISTALPIPMLIATGAWFGTLIGYLTLQALQAVCITMMALLMLSQRSSPQQAELPAATND